MKVPSKILCALLFGLAPSVMAKASHIDDVAAYHNNSRWQKHSAQSAFDGFNSQYQLKGDESLLDLCSGDGKVTHYIAHILSRGRVVGVDSSSKMVHFANKYYTNPNLSFVVTDAQDLHYKNEFDIITSFTCLHLVDDIESTIRGVEQSLKPGGKILFQIPYDHGLSYALDLTTSSEKWAPYFSDFQTPWHLLHPDTYRHHLLRSGLQPIRVEITQMHEIYDSASEFETSISNWLPHVKHLAEPLRGDFMADLISNYLSYMPSDDEDRVHYYVDRVEVEAKK